MGWPAAIGVAWLIGWLPVGNMIKRLFRQTNPCLVGFEETSLIRLLKEGGPEAVLLVLATDVGKGVASALAAGWLTGSATAGLVAGLVAQAAYFYGRNGKGLLVVAGAVYICSPSAAQTGAAVWMASLLLGRFQSVASVLAVWSTPVWALIFGEGIAKASAMLAMAVLLTFQYRDEFRQVLEGKEHPLQWKRLFQRGKQAGRVEL